MQLAVSLKPANPATLRREDLPTIPTWWPLPGAIVREQHPEWSGEQHRRALAISSACEGPYDDTRLTARGHDGTNPDPTVSMAEGTIVYALDEAASNARVLVYRYSPQLSIGHRTMMRAVEMAFLELGSDYAQEARQDDTAAPGYALAHDPTDG